MLSIFPPSTFRTPPLFRLPSARSACHRWLHSPAELPSLQKRLRTCFASNITGTRRVASRSIAGKFEIFSCSDSTRYASLSSLDLNQLSRRSEASVGQAVQPLGWVRHATEKRSVHDGDPDELQDGRRFNQAHLAELKLDLGMRWRPCKPRCGQVHSQIRSASTCQDSPFCPERLSFQRLQEVDPGVRLLLKRRTSTPACSRSSRISAART